MAVGRRHHLSFPRELGVSVKAVVMCEGRAARLDPTFALLHLFANSLEVDAPPGFDTGEGPARAH
jgi:predicted unusual protein kinase regulating ubiquinone biosynthesis (AarF/ABC1/UbiB family)